MRTSLRSTAARRATLALATVAVVGTVAAGCGSSSKGSSTADLPSAPPTTTAPQQTTTPSDQPSSTPSDTTSDTPSDTPSSSSSSDSDRATEYKSVLLSASEVSKITGEDFTAEPSSDDTVTNSDEPSGCDALDDFVKESKDAERGKASASFTTADQAQEAEEQITYVPDEAEKLFTQLKGALNSCDSLGTGNDALTLAVQDDPEVQGADDTLSFTASTTTSGKSIVVTGMLARFGDNIVQITYSAIGPEDSPTIGDTELLTQAASKADTVLA